MSDSDPKPEAQAGAAPGAEANLDSTAEPADEVVTSQPESGAAPEPSAEARTEPTAEPGNEASTKDSGKPGTWFIRHFAFRYALLLIPLLCVAAAIATVVLVPDWRGTVAAESGASSSNAEADALTAERTVSVSENALHLVCMPGLASGEEVLGDDLAAALADAAVTSRANQSTLSEANSMLDGNSSLLHGFAVSGDAEGELRGLVADSCRPTSGDLYVVAGSTMVGETSVLYLSNPSETSVTVTIDGYGETGQIAAGTQTVTVSAGQTQAVLLAIWYPQQERLGLHLQADAGGVVAWVQSSSQEGDIPQGVTTIPATSATSQAAFVGVSESDETYLRILNPGSEMLTVRVDVSGAEGTETLAGAETIQVSAGAVFDVSLAGIGEEISSILVTTVGDSEGAVFSATVFEAVTGNASSEDETIDYRALTNVTNTVASTDFTLPGSEWLEAVSERGFTDVTATVVVSAQEDATLSFGSNSGSSSSSSASSSSEDSSENSGETITVAGGTTQTLDLPAGELVVVTASSPVQISVVVEAQTDSGLVRAVLPVLGDSDTNITRRVELTPSF